MKMRAPGDFTFSAFVGDIPAGVKLEDFEPKWYAHELENVGTDVSILLNKEITLKCGTLSLSNGIQMVVRQYHADKDVFRDSLQGRQIYICERSSMEN